MVDIVFLNLFFNLCTDYSHLSQTKTPAHDSAFSQKNLWWQTMSRICFNFQLCQISLQSVRHPKFFIQQNWEVISCQINFGTVGKGSEFMRDIILRFLSNYDSVCEFGGGVEVSFWGRSCLEEVVTSVCCFLDKRDNSGLSASGGGGGIRGGKCTCVSLQYILWDVEDTVTIMVMLLILGIRII